MLADVLQPLGLCGAHTASLAQPQQLPLLIEAQLVPPAAWLPPRRCSASHAGSLPAVRVKHLGRAVLAALAGPDHCLASHAHCGFLS